MGNAMRFVTDLSKGILGEADSPELWAEIISHIPDAVLLEPNVKILNVSCGHGTEADLLVKRMRALGISAQDVNDSIYLLDKYHVFTNRAAHKGYKNVITADFLEWETDMKFDVIVGNPPYQDKDLPENNALWPRFVNKSIDLLQNSGFLAMITPSSWMNPSGEEVKRNSQYNTGLIRKNIFGKYNTIAINVSAAVKKYFNVGSSFSYFVVKKEPAIGSTLITIDGGTLSVNLSSEAFLPALLSKESYSITKKFFTKPLLGVTNMKGEGFHSSHSKRVVKIKTPGFNFPLADTSAKYLNGIFLWANEAHPYQFTKKVIISESGYLGPMYDSGTLGTTEHSFVIPVTTDEQGKEIVTQLNSKIYKFIMTVCRWGSANHKYIIKNLPKAVGTSDRELYQYFGLTQEEIDYVEANVK